MRQFSIWDKNVCVGDSISSRNAQDLDFFLTVIPALTAQAFKCESYILNTNKLNL